MTRSPRVRRVTAGEARQLAHLSELEGHLAKCDRAIAQQARDDPRAVRVTRLSGVGALTASAVVATVVDPSQFRCGRQVSQVRAASV